ncbi:MAG: tetratricopeptide repeat protein [bacterium]
MHITFKQLGNSDGAHKAFVQYAANQINQIQVDGLETQLTQQISEQSLPPLDSTAVEVRLLLAELYAHIGKIKQQLPITDELLKYQEKIKTFKNSDTLLGKLWTVRSDNLEQAGQFEQAITASKNALNYFSKAYPENHPYIATAMGHISTSYFELNDYPQAEKYIRSTLDKFTQTYGPAHSDTLWANYQLGRTLLEEYKLDEAQRIFTSMRSIVVEKFGAEHSYVSMLEANLGNISRAQHTYPEALKHFKNALSIYKKQDSGNPKKALLIAHIARIYADMGNLDQAGHFYQQSLLILKDKLGEEHPVTQKTTLSYIRYLNQRMLYKQALKQASITCPILTKTYSATQAYAIACQLALSISQYNLNPTSQNRQSIELNIDKLSASTDAKKFAEQISHARLLDL